MNWKRCHADRSGGSSTDPLPLILWLLLCLFPATVHAEITLEQWRQQVTEARKLTDNNPAQAYAAAQYLQDTLPVNAMPADRIRVLNVLARTEVYLTQTEQAADHARQALNLARQHADNVGQVEAQLNISINAIYRGEVDTSVVAMTNSLELLDDIDRPDLLAEAMLRLMTSYHRLNLIDEAVTLALQNLEIAKQSGDLRALALAYQGLAVLYEQTGRYQEAYEYFQQMYDYSRRDPSRLLEGHALTGMANVLRHLDAEIAIEPLLQDAVALFREAGLLFSLMNVQYNYADFLFNQQRYAEAEVILRETITFYQHHQSRIGFWYTLNMYADTLNMLRRDQEARQVIEQAYRLAVEIGYPRYIEGSARKMADIAVAAADYQQAYQYIAEATVMAERDVREKTSKRIVDLTERYKVESKQRQIDKLNLQAERQATELKQHELQQNLLWTILIASLILLVGSGWFSMKLRRSNLMLTVLNSEVQQSQSKLQATLDAIPDLLFVLDLNGVFHECHSPYPDRLLMPVDGFIGKTVFDVLPDEVAREYMLALHEARSQGRSAGRQYQLSLADGLHYQLSLVGGVHWFELSVANRALTLGEGRQFIVLVRDISERKKMEQALISSEQQFRALVEHSPDAVARYDRLGRRTYINPTLERVLGMPAANVLGKSLDEWSLEQFDSEYQRQLNQVIATGVEGRLTMRVIAASGEELYSDVRFAPEFGFDGQVASVLTVGRDITSLKEAERRIEEAYAQLRELVGRRDEVLEEERKRIARDMHDELGQYLTMLRMKVSVLRMQVGAHESKMDEQLLAMMFLLDTTIQVVRQIASQLRPAQLEMGITAALEWLVEDFSKTSGIVYKLDSNSDEMKMNDNQAIAIFRIVQESLTNVVRYAQASEVNVCLQLQGSGYYLQIRDNGIGFDPDAIQKKSFGLLGMRERAANLGGSVNIISRPGQGTKIEARLPLEQSKEAS